MPTDPAVNRPRLLCPKCCRIQVLSADEAAQYAHSGWPKCCGQVMVYLNGGDPSTVKETTPDLPTFD